MNLEQLPYIKEDLPPRWRFSLRLLLLAVTLLAILIALITPAVFAAREAANRMKAANKVKSIVGALHNYQSQNNTFPYGVVRNADGKPMHGWRFAISPFIESTDIYHRYDQRLAWDDPSNLAVTQFVWYWYVREGQRNRVPHATNFVAITGPGTLFPDDRVCSPGDIKDGAKNTIVVVEIGPSDIPWYEPRDLRIDTMSFRINDPDRSKPCIGSRLSGGAIVGFADGHTELLPEDTPPEKLRAMLTIAGGD
jgi:prepilin-type processing-associated H-X9-DG protein